MPRAAIVSEPRRIFHRKEQPFRHFISALVISSPALAFCLYVLSYPVTWPSPILLMSGLLVMLPLNFAVIMLLEAMRSAIGSTTIPALLASTGMTLAFVLTEALNRFFVDFGYSWMFPLMLATQALVHIALFREKHALLKLFLCLNSLALTVLWGLGEADKVALPF